MGHREKVAICKPRRETSRETNLKKKKKEKETNPASTSVLDFQPPVL